MKPRETLSAIALAAVILGVFGFMVNPPSRRTGSAFEFTVGLVSLFMLRRRK